MAKRKESIENRKHIYKFDKKKVKYNHLENGYKMKI